jgi:hypothetical protein
VIPVPARRFRRIVQLAALLSAVAACGARQSGGGDSESHFVNRGDGGNPEPSVRVPPSRYDASAPADVPDAAAPRALADLGPQLDAMSTALEPLDAGAAAPEPPQQPDAAQPYAADASVVVAPDAADSVVYTPDAAADAALAQGFSAPELALLLTNTQLWDLAVGTEAPGIGACWVEDSTNKSGLCDYYVKSGIQGADLDFGWPKSSANTSTGCVYGPNTGKQQSYCFYPEREADFCTPDTRTNVVNQLRDALANDACGDVSAVTVEPATEG